MPTDWSRDPERLHPLLQIARRSVMTASRVARGMLLGARALLVRDRAVLLVRHTYVPGWYLPGGGVAPGETAEAAARREALEEAGAELVGPLDLFGFYHNPAAHPRDHVAVYLAREWRDVVPAPWPNLEIAERGVFPIDRLPDATTEATRRRLAELAGAPRSATW